MKKFFYTIIAALILLACTTKTEKPFNLTISTLPAGYSAYALGIGVTKLINENSEWLEATHIEGRGPAEHMKLLVKNPIQRKNYLFLNTTWDQWQAEKGIGAYRQFPFTYSNFKFVCFLGKVIRGLITLNPNIKTLKDLAGKKVIFDSAPNKPRTLVYKGILKAADVPLDKVRLEFAYGRAAANALKDGCVDAISFTAVLIKWPNTFVLSPYITELASTRKIYFISLDEEDVLEFKKKTAHPVGYLRLRPQILTKDQEKSCGVLTATFGFSAHIDMPDKVVNEILRILYEYYYVLKDYSPIGEAITREALASLGIPKETYHPAAIKFFEEKGIEIK